MRGADWSRGLPSDAEQYYPEWQNFQFAPNNHYKFFFLHTLSSNIVFKLLNMRYFINLVLKYIVYRFGSYLQRPGVMNKVVLHALV